MLCILCILWCVWCGLCGIVYCVVSGYASQIRVPDTRPKYASQIGVPIRVPNELFIKVSNSGGPGGVFVCGGCIRVPTWGVYASQLGGIFCVLCELYGKVCILPGLHGRYVW